MADIPKIPSTPSKIPVSRFWMNPGPEELGPNDTRFAFGYTDKSGKEWKYKITQKDDDREAFNTFVWKIKDAMGKRGNKKDFSYLPWPGNEMKDLTKRVNVQNITHGEQQTLKLASMVDSISNRIEAIGLLKEAYDLDVIANTIQSGKWWGVDSIGFWDEISNQNIDTETAVRILDAFDKGADAEYTCSRKTGIDVPTCKAVIDIADSSGLITVINDGNYEEWVKKNPPPKGKKKTQTTREPHMAPAKGAQ